MTCTDTLTTSCSTDIRRMEVDIRAIQLLDPVSPSFRCRICMELDANPMTL